LKIVFLDSYTLNPGDLDLSPISELGELHLYDRTNPDQILDRCQDAEIIISNKVKIGLDIMHSLPSLKFIQVAATGTNNIDLDAAKSIGLPVCNAVGYSSISVAQHVFAVLLSYHNQVDRYFKDSTNLVWSQQSDFSYWHRSLKELSGQTLGVWGFGNIGRAVTKIALSFGMKVIVINKYPQHDPLPEVRNVTKEELLAESDIITLHTSLNDSTFEMINAESLAHMKPTALLVNTGRGQLINESDLYHALESNQIQAAFLDVLSKEPPDADHLLLKAKNCFITPHQAWASLEARKRLLKIMVQNIKSYTIGELNSSLTT